MNLKQLTLIATAVFTILIGASITFFKKQDLVVNGQVFKINNFTKNGTNLELLSETDKYKITCAVEYNFFKKVHPIVKLQPIANMKGFYLLNDEAVGTILQKDSRGIASSNAKIKAMILKNEQQQYFCLLR
jgi:hypothetical protein